MRRAWLLRGVLTAGKKNLQKTNALSLFFPQTNMPQNGAPPRVDFSGKGRFLFSLFPVRNAESEFSRFSVKKRNAVFSADRKKPRTTPRLSSFLYFSL